MAFSSQVVLGHDSWSFRNMRLQALQCVKNGIKWMLGMKVVMSQSWEKDADFCTYKNSMFYFKKWPIMSCIQTWPSTWNLLMTKKRWHEVDLLNDILGLEPFKISKNWESYEFLKLAKKSWNDLKYFASLRKLPSIFQLFT